MRWALLIIIPGQRGQTETVLGRTSACGLPTRAAPSFVPHLFSALRSVQLCCHCHYSFAQATGTFEPKESKGCIVFWSS